MASDEVADLLRQLLDEVRELRSDLAAAQRERSPLLDRTLRAIDGVLGREPFDAARLIELARARVPGRAALRQVIEEIVRDLDAPGAGRRLGRWLALHAGDTDTSCECRLEHLRKTRSGTGYRVAKTAEVADETRIGHRWRM